MQILFHGCHIVLRHPVALVGLRSKDEPDIVLLSVKSELDEARVLVGRICELIKMIERKSVLLTDGFPDFVIAVTAALFSVFDLFSHHKENVTKAERRYALCHGYILNLADEQLKDMYLRLETLEEAVRTSKLPGHVWDIRPERQLELILPMFEYSNEPSLETRNAEIPTGPNEPQEDLRPSSTLSYRPEGEETLLGRISDSMTQVLGTEIFLFGNRAILQRFDFDVAHMKDYKDDFSSLVL